MLQRPPPTISPVSRPPYGSNTATAPAAAVASRSPVGPTHDARLQTSSKRPTYFMSALHLAQHSRSKPLLQSEHTHGRGLLRIFLNERSGEWWCSWFDSR